MPSDISSMLEKGLGSGESSPVDHPKSTSLQIENLAATSASKDGASDPVNGIEPCVLRDQGSLSSQRPSSMVSKSASMDPVHAPSSNLQKAKRSAHRWGHGRHQDPKAFALLSCSARRRTNGILVEAFPRGYPRLACFLDSDDTFMVYKRFGMVFSRLLLNKQDEVRELEMKLHAMDNADNKTDAGKNFLMSRRDDLQREKDSRPRWWNETRPELLQRLEKKVLEYCKVF